MFSRDLQTHIDIQAPPQAVWEVLEKVHEWRSWNPTLSIATDSSGGGGGGSGKLAPGQVLHITATLPGRKPWSFKPTLLVVEPGKELRWRGSLPIPGLFTGEHYFTLQEGPSPGTTGLTHGEAFSGLLLPLLGGVLAATEQGFEAMNAALKRRVEEGAAAAGGGAAAGSGGGS